MPLPMKGEQANHPCAALFRRNPSAGNTGAGEVVEAR